MVCQICSLDAETQSVKIPGQGTTDGASIANLEVCSHCMKFLVNKENEPSEGKTNLQVVSPQGQSPQVAPEAPDASRPVGWPDYAIWPLPKGAALPPGFQYNGSTGKLERK